MLYSWQDQARGTRNAKEAIESYIGSLGRNTMNRSRKTLERKKYWMPKLPILSGKDVIRAPTKGEYVFNHKTGSHITSKTVKEEE